MGAPGGGKPASAQSKEREDRQDHNHNADQIDKSVHESLPTPGPAEVGDVHRTVRLRKGSTAQPGGVLSARQGARRTDPTPQGAGGVALVARSRRSGRECHEAPAGNKLRSSNAATARPVRVRHHGAAGRKGLRRSARAVRGGRGRAGPIRRRAFVRFTQNMRWRTSFLSNARWFEGEGGAPHVFVECRAAPVSVMGGAGAAILSETAGAGFPSA